LPINIWVSTGKEKIPGFVSICGEIIQMRDDIRRYGYLELMRFNLFMLKKG